MERLLTYADAIREATEQEMERDAAIILFGLGVDDFKAIFGTTKGLLERFGPDRVSDTPLAEEAMTGVAIGAALAGLRPIHVHARMDYLLVAMNQLVNAAAKLRYMSGGTVKVPIVVRATIGRSWGQGPTHSQGLHALLMHIPGLKVAAPSTPYDAKGLLIESIRDDNPVVFMEHRMLHYQKGHVPAEPYTVPFGRARVLARGDDVTLVGISYMALECLRAARSLEEAGIHADVIDPVSLSPLDTDAMVDSVRRTGRLVVVDTSWTMCGATAEITARVVERLPGRRVQVHRMGYAPVPCPTTKNLQDIYYPTVEQIARAGYRLVRGEAGTWAPAAPEAPELVAFKGPF